MGRLQSSQRRREVELLSFCFKKLGTVAFHFAKSNSCVKGISVLGSISEPGYLEGGDFFPAGLDLCFIGIGLRSNYAACQQLMDQDWLGTRYVAVVKDLFDQNQDRMHLDCIFSITGYDSSIMLKDVMSIESPKRRLVDEYVRDPMTRRYTLASENNEFSTYVQSKGFNIIPITCQDQLKYGCNVLNLGQERILSVNATCSRQLVRSSHFNGSVEVNCCRDCIQDSYLSV